MKGAEVMLRFTRQPELLQCDAGHIIFYCASASNITPRLRIYRCSPSPLLFNEVYKVINDTLGEKRDLRQFGVDKTQLCD